MKKDKKVKYKSAEEIEEHDFVKEMVRDPKNPPKLKIIQGYVGKSPQEKHLRIYLDIELRGYVDVPMNAIVAYKDFRKGKDPLASVFIWIEENTKVIHNGSWFASEDPTTMATGEEGGDPTTMATGEESASPFDPSAPLINPFDGFVKF